MSIHLPYRGAAVLIRWTALAGVCLGLAARGATTDVDAGLPDVSSGFALSIHASPTSGPSPLHVHLEAVFDGGAPPLLRELWDFGQGQAGIGSTADVDYPDAGRYHVKLLVVEKDGGTVSAEPVEITVTADGGIPPDCRATASPAVVGLGQVVTWSDGPSMTTTGSAHWDFTVGDPADAMDVRRIYGQPGWVIGKLTVTDDDGLTCTDRATALVRGDGGTPPLIIGGENPRATCGQPYGYSSSGTAVAVGTGPLSWSADAPEGFEIDPETGRVSWMPRASEAGQQTVVIRVSGPGGTDEQHFMVDVSCPEVSLQTPFGCGVAGGPTGFLPALLCLLGWSWAVRRRGAQRAKRRT